MASAHYTPGVVSKCFPRTLIQILTILVLQYYRAPNGDPLPIHPFIPPGLRSLQPLVPSNGTGGMIGTEISGPSSNDIDPALQEEPESPMSSRQARSRAPHGGPVALGESGLSPDVQKAVEAVLSINPDVVAQAMDTVELQIQVLNSGIDLPHRQTSPISPETYHNSLLSRPNHTRPADAPRNALNTPVR